MMTVGFDITSLAENCYGGIATVCRHTLLQAAACRDIHPTALYRRGSSENLDETGVPARHVSWLDHLGFNRYDIVHALCHRIPPVRGRKLVYTLHDVWSLYPNRYQSAGFQSRIGPRMVKELQRADAIVCDSNATFERLKELSLIDPARCHVVHPGGGLPVPGDFPQSASLELRPDSFENFVLFVGRIEVRKNLEHVVEAVLPLENVHLVIVGEFGFGGREIAAHALGRMPSERLHLLDRVTDRELSLLYQRALVSLQPSWEEGFGLPMLEAMAHGCPLITANCSASSEIAGDGAILVDPAKPEQSTAAIQNLLNDPVARQKWGESGRPRSRLFSWDAYFRKLLGLYQSLG